MVPLPACLPACQSVSQSVSQSVCLSVFCLRLNVLLYIDLRLTLSIFGSSLNLTLSVSLSPLFLYLSFISFLTNHLFPLKISRQETQYSVHLALEPGQHKQLSNRLQILIEQWDTFQGWIKDNTISKKTKKYFDAFGVSKQQSNFKVV